MLSVVEIEIEGQKFPVRYDINALGELEELTGQNTLDGSMQFNIRALHSLAYVGLKHGHGYQTRNATAFSKTKEEVGAWLPISCLKMFPPILIQFTQGDQEKNKKTGESDSPGESPGAV